MKYILLFYAFSATTNEYTLTTTEFNNAPACLAAKATLDAEPRRVLLRPPLIACVAKGSEIK